jgi:ATP-dependent Lon protease
VGSQSVTTNPITTPLAAPVTVATNPPSAATPIVQLVDKVETLPVTTKSTTSSILADEIGVLKNKVSAAILPEDLREKVDKMLLRLERMAAMNTYSGEYEPVEKYINWVTQLPFGKYTQDDLDLQHVKAMLDKTHFGLEAVKEKILEYISVMKLKTMEGISLEQQNQPTDNVKLMSELKGNSANAPVVLFVGVQGIGKTSITKSIANALGRRMLRIPLGALADAALIKGRPRGYPDAEPGLITKALIRTGVMNPVLLLDEIDKVSDKGGARADLMAALLEILDPEQNSTFLDLYFDYPIDLSKCMLICTANNLGGITAAVLDRLEIIRLNSYTDEEKKHIAKDYLLPKVRSATGITAQQLDFDDEVWDVVIRPMGFDAGVRQLERVLANLARKVARKIVMGEGTSFLLTKQNFRDFIPEDIGVYS